MKMMAFSGWGQDPRSLAGIIPKTHASCLHIHYQNFDGYSELLPFLEGKACDVVLGWSLGGQIALRAIHEGVLQPKALILIGTPYAFLQSGDNPFGMEIDRFNRFEQEYYHHPKKTIRKFLRMIHQGDSKERILVKEQQLLLPPYEGWLKWLRELRYFSCDDIDFSKLPKTLLIHGKQDRIVRVEQTELLYPHFEHCKLLVLEDAAHAPHLHAPALVHQFIQQDIAYLPWMR